jgi:dolichyl-diphosphooligosaccharide--protein glycosyltransferase
LILLTAPIASALAGIAIGRFVAWGISGLVPFEETADMGGSATSGGSGGKSSNNNNKRKRTARKDSKNATDDGTGLGWSTYSEPLWSRLARICIVLFCLKESVPLVRDFHAMAHQLAGHLSHPTIIQKAQTRDGKTIKIDDYRDAYFWLRDNTPEDARIMAWWDYGYQITGIANRTTMADGNTWNHEHIALLGKTLTAPEIEAHRVVRHMADYVLVWAGGGGDDLAKSPHLRRIANSVYRGLCEEPTCRDFGFYSDRTPTPPMKLSLLYKLCLGGLQPDVVVDKNRFREVYRSKYGKVRIYKIQSVSEESKLWVADPANRKCDAPGSWFCPGQYPPALHKIINEKKNFAQLEDFNKKSEDDSEYDSDYQRDYFDNLQKSGGRRPSEADRRKKEELGAAEYIPSAEKPAQNDPDAMSKHGLDEFKETAYLDDEDIDIINDNWENSELTTLLWELIHHDKEDEFYQLIQESPSLVHIRSDDGRGPMFWAHEYGRAKMVASMRKLRVREDRKDSKGLTPLDVSAL